MKRVIVLLVLMMLAVTVVAQSANARSGIVVSGSNIIGATPTAIIDGAVELKHLSCTDAEISGTSSKKFVGMTVNNVFVGYITVPDPVIFVGAAGPVPVAANGAFDLNVHFTRPLKWLYVAISVWEEDSNPGKQSVVAEFDHVDDCPTVTVTAPPVVHPHLVTPTPSAAVQAVSLSKVYMTAQRFDHGLMTWRQDNGDIWVLVENGDAFKYPTAIYSGLSEQKVNNPANRIEPILGFGKIWSNFSDIRSALGWPVLPEIGFTSLVRTSNEAQPRIEFTQLDGQILTINKTERGYSWQLLGSMMEF